MHFLPYIFMKNLKYLRLKKEYTQTTLADFLGVGTGVVARWELGQTCPSLCQLLKLCRILCCSPAQLLLDDEYLCDNVHSTFIPLFREDDVTAYPLSASAEETLPHFGIVLPYDVSERISEGDICFFTIADSAAEGNTVIAVSGDGEEKIVQYSAGSDYMVIAVCTGLRRSI